MGDKKRVSGSDGIGWGGVVVFGVLGWGAWLWLLEWWAVHGVTVLRRARLVGVAVLGRGVDGFGWEVVVETPVSGGPPGTGG